MAAMVLGIYAGAAQAQEGQVEVPRGLWQTEPDTFGVVLLVRTRACGRSLCARVERAKNRAGYDAPSGAVGQKVFWSMDPRPDGSFFGEYRSPKAEQFRESRVEVAGRILRLRACRKQDCRATEWKRVK
ncbi:hypothetical protein [Sulfitobacter noctilucicola]|uniref:hypothetical protein n=1 Tax=Sulfitobacter noctilucicola TaxID=1342301 RepID=UPI001363DF27|nr:hypothetical protein [Sulfitobacter noctilucicola]